MEDGRLDPIEQLPETLDQIVIAGAFHNVGEGRPEFGLAKLSSAGMGWQISGEALEPMKNKRSGSLQLATEQSGFNTLPPSGVRE
jgi:hypothetical protein